MKLKEFYNKNRKMVGFILVIIGLLFVMGNYQEDSQDKKEGTFGLSLSVAGLILLGMGIVLSLTGIGYIPGAVMMAIGAFILIFGVKGVLSPTPTIPGWAYVVGFIAIILIIKKGGK